MVMIPGLSAERRQQNSLLCSAASQGKPPPADPCCLQGLFQLGLWYNGIFPPRLSHGQSSPARPPPGAACAMEVSDPSTTFPLEQARPHRTGLGSDAGCEYSETLLFKWGRY